MSRFPGIGAIVHYFAPGAPDTPRAAIVTGGGDSGDECRLDLTVFFPGQAAAIALGGVHHHGNWKSAKDVHHAALKSQFEKANLAHEALKLSGGRTDEQISLSESRCIAAYRALEEHEQSFVEPRNYPGWWM